MCFCVINFKWIDGVKCYGYKGVFEMVVIVDYLFVYDVMVRVVCDDQYESVIDVYLNDNVNCVFLQQYNLDVLYDMCEWLLEVIQWGFWQEFGDYW